MSSTSLMTHRVTVRRNTPTDTAGKIAAVWADFATGVACLIQEGSGSFKQRADGRIVTYDAVGYFPIATDLRPRGAHVLNDVLVVTSPTWLAGNTYQVKACVDESGRGDHLTAYLAVMTPSVEG